LSGVAGTEEEVGCVDRFKRPGEIVQPEFQNRGQC
jgi:hypothetical protein